MYSYFVNLVKFSLRWLFLFVQKVEYLVKGEQLYCSKVRFLTVTTVVVDGSSLELYTPFIIVYCCFQCNLLQVALFSILA